MGDIVDIKGKKIAANKLPQRALQEIVALPVFAFLGMPLGFINLNNITRVSDTQEGLGFMEFTNGERLLLDESGERAFQALMSSGKFPVLAVDHVESEAE